MTDAAVKLIAETGYDQAFGARPLKRLINKELNQQVAKLLLAGSLKNGQTLRVEVVKDELRLTPVAEVREEVSR